MADNALSTTLKKLTDVIDILEIGVTCNDQDQRNDMMMKARTMRAAIDMSAVDQQATDVQTLIANYNQVQAQITAINSQLATRKQVIALPDTTIPATALITLTAGEKEFANLTVAGVKTTDYVIVGVKSMPAGYGLRAFSIPAADRMTYRLQCPVLQVGGSAVVLSNTAFR